MNKINQSFKNKYSPFRGFNDSSDQKSHGWGSAHIQHQLHEKKIDEFFWTNIEAPHKRVSALALAGSAIGVLAPILAIAKKKNPGIKLNSLKNIYQATKIKYELKEILTVGYGGLFGGLIGGLADRKEPNKLDKIQEGTFQFLNISCPTILVAKTVDICEKHKKLNKNPVKLLGSAAAMFAGINIAVFAANKIDNKLFDKYNVEPDRKFKKKDFVVHIDDLVGSLVLAKLPIANKLHPEKILPLIFAWSGFSVGEK